MCHVVCSASVSDLCRSFFYYVAHFLAAVRNRCLWRSDRLFEFEMGRWHGVVPGMKLMQFDLLVTRADESSRLYLPFQDLKISTAPYGIVQLFFVTTALAMTEKSSRPQIGDFAISTVSASEATTQILARLGNRYCLLQPHKTIDDFGDEILMPLATAAVDQPAKIKVTYFRAHSEQPYASLMKFLLAACKDCIEADKAEEAADHSGAWRHVANAMYRLGVLEGLIVVEPALEHIISSRSAKGGQSRTVKLEPLRNLARELAQEKPFKSKRQAALSIKDAVLTKARNNGITLSEMQAERTITSWLGDMSFGGKRES